jgi:hypothetical protein
MVLSDWQRLLKMNYLHPIFVEYSYQIGSRIDIARLLPVKPDMEDEELLLDMLSEPPRYNERIAPVSTRIGQEIVRGKNWTELMVKGYRIYTQIYSYITAYVTQTMRDVFRENGMVPFLTLGIDPDTLHRILELDYELNENTYGKIIKLYSNGVIAPCVTIPFHLILPSLKNEYDIRLLIRMSFIFYWPILKLYYENVVNVHKEKTFVISYWLPEGGYNRRVLEILHEEFSSKCREEGIADFHLCLLLDDAQTVNQDNDILMKTWNIVPISEDKKEFISVVFKDRNFSDWVTFSNPSVKKLLDRTIAKMDSALNEKSINYCWSHFEDIAALTYTVKAANNFEQKIIKLTELGYLPISPDVFVRRKLNQRFGLSPKDPNVVTLRENTTWNDWHQDNISLGRWAGTLDSAAEYKLVDENHPYLRVTANGEVEEPGPQCWKLALNKAMDICCELVTGNPETLEGGMMEVLADLVPSEDPDIIRRNVDNFLLYYSMLHWREHFLQHDFTEADLNIEEIVTTYLLQDLDVEFNSNQFATAAVAAQAYYFALDSKKSCATFWENFDQRAVYQNLTMLVLAMVNAVHIYKWQKKGNKAKKIIQTMKNELIQFETAYSRYNLAEYGITEVEWNDAIKSTIDDTTMNIVERSTRKIAARHLRPLGYDKEFTEEDEMLSASVGHIWSSEVINSNYSWDNRIFCGLHEE